MRAFVVPVGLYIDPATGSKVPVAFLQQVDHLLPTWAGKLKAIGGEVEAGEDPFAAIAREAEEEVPGWLEQARVPGTSKGWLGHRAVKGMVPVHKDDRVAVWALYVDVGPMSWAAYRRATKESCPVSHTAATLAALGPDAWAFPAMGEAVINLLKSL